MKLNKIALLPLVMSLPLMAATPASHWSPQDIVLMTEFCQGDPAAVTTVRNYCKENGCSDYDKTVTDNFCSELAAEEQAATTAPPPPPPAEVQAPTSTPATTMLNSQLVQSYCRGSGSAFDELYTLCAAGSCTSQMLADIDSNCQQMGSTTTTLKLAHLATTGPVSPPPEQQQPAPPPVNTYSPDEALVQSYCQGSGKAFDEIYAQCKAGNCTSQMLADIDSDCRQLGSTTTTLLMSHLATTGPVSPPPEQQLPAPPPVNTYSPDEALVRSYCQGSGKAFDEIYTQCKAGNCTGQMLADINDSCQQIGSSVTTQLMAALVTDSPLPPPLTPPLPQTTPPPATGEHSLMVSWEIPTERIDGQQLGASELSGYEIYLTADTTGVNQRITVDNPYTTEHIINKLAPDTYYVALVSIDSEGILSELSQLVSATISDS